jgi:hypothetical protein
MARGRPKTRPVLTPEFEQEICDRLSGGEAITEICGPADMPSLHDVYLKMAQNEDFRERIARAREAQQHHEADKCVQMADDATAEDWQVVRLRIWARQWRASKLAPKTYGDKLQTEHSGNLTLETIRREDTDALTRSLVAGLIASGVEPGVAREIVRAATADGTGETGE